MPDHAHGREARDDLDFGARSNNNRVQLGAMWRGHAEVEIRPHGESFQLAGHAFVFDGYDLTVDGKSYGTISVTDRIEVSSSGVDVERR